MILIANPTTKKVYLTDARRETLYRFDGTPLGGRDCAGWPTVHTQDVPCLFEWQRDPGLYGPHYATYRIMVDRENTFTAGGSILFIRSWLEEHAHWGSISISIYTDRNAARAAAEVEW